MSSAEISGLHTIVDELKERLDILHTAVEELQLNHAEFSVNEATLCELCVKLDGMKLDLSSVKESADKRFSSVTDSVNKLGSNLNHSDSQVQKDVTERLAQLEAAFKVTEASAKLAGRTQHDTTTRLVEAEHSIKDHAATIEAMSGDMLSSFKGSKPAAHTAAVVVSQASLPVPKSSGGPCGAGKGSGDHHQARLPALPDRNAVLAAPWPGPRLGTSQPLPGNAGGKRPNPSAAIEVPSSKRHKASELIALTGIEDDNPSRTRTQ